LEEGTTTLQFTVGVDGLTHDITVYASSGYADLDQAAATCASGWLYKPAMQNGKPVAVLWRANVVWKAPAIIPPVGYDRSAHQCASASGLSGNQSEALESSLSFWVDADGNVKALRVLQSSGDKEFDAALLKCVSSWTYTPATRNGVAVRVVWGARFHATSSDGISMLEGPARSHFCAPVPYSAKASGNGVEATTVLAFGIDARGNLEDIAVAQSSGDDTLDELSKACAANWRYTPEVKDRRRVTVRWSAQVTWRDRRSIVAELGNGDEPP
jgi:TonB family protein